jgi:prepilin-type N-terminal cleavage/methylation domain-containing protein
MPGERGFTLAELLVAAAVIVVGLVGVAVTIPVTSYAVRDGAQLSGATFLAEARLEQVRGASWAMLAGGQIGDCLGVSGSASDAPTSSECPGRTGRQVTFPDDAAGSLPAPFEGYARSVRIAPCDAASACPVTSHDLRRVTVTVAYVPTSGVGGNATASTRPVVLSSFVARRF